MSLQAKVGLTVAADNLSKLHIMDEVVSQCKKWQLTHKTTSFHNILEIQNERAKTQQGPWKSLLPGASRTTGLDCVSLWASQVVQR